MRMAAIKKIIMDAKRCIIVNDTEGKQWIGDGKRFYAVDEDIRFERNTALTILDIEKDKRNKVVVFQEESKDPRFSIYDKDDEERLTPHMAMMYGGELILIFMNDRRELFALEHASIKPIGDGREYVLRRREANGEEMRPAIAVKVDMFTTALLEPMDAKVMTQILAGMMILSAGSVTSYGNDEEELVSERTAGE